MDAIWNSFVEWLRGFGAQAGQQAVEAGAQIGGQVAEGVGAAASQLDMTSLLALAEYVNYYHRQLQHFDNWPDFRRLMTGKGFRPAKMAVDLAAWRAARG